MFATTELPNLFESTTMSGNMDSTTYADLAEMTTMSPTPELHHNQITFEIPSHRDLEHIDTLHNFSRLLQRIGNVAYDAVGNTRTDYVHTHPATNGYAAMDEAGQDMINKQISRSAVLNLADLKNNELNSWDRFFDGTDVHTIINYLWVGVVSSLVVLSVIFIIFSCYFYRKFRQWKKCNKDIRSHINNDMYPGGTIVTCDSHLPLTHQNIDAAYYQMESPPCYTIATGLPTYDEALHQQHYAYGMKFMYPTMAAVHHHQLQPHNYSRGATSQNFVTVAGVLTNWEKDDLAMRYKEEEEAMYEQQQQQQQCQMQKSLTHKVSEILVEAPPNYVALPTGEKEAEAAANATESLSPTVQVAMESPTDSVDDCHEVCIV